MLVALRLAVSQKVLWTLMDVSLKQRKTTCPLGPTPGISISNIASANSLTTGIREKLF